MTDTKFTKGEWKLIAENKNSSICSTSSGHFHIETDDTHKFISIQNEHKEESEANAHLIAAAPDMYKMIESLTKELELAITSINVSIMKGVTQQTETQPDLWDMESLHEAQLLLSKARGE